MHEKSPPPPTPLNPIQVYIPSEIALPCNESLLSKVYYKRHLFAGVSPAGFRQANHSISLSIFSCKKKLQVTNLKENILLIFPINTNILKRNISS